MIYDQTLRELLAQLEDGRIGVAIPKEDDPETMHAFLLRATAPVCDFVLCLAHQAQAEGTRP